MAAEKTTAAKISIHALLAESDQGVTSVYTGIVRFLSTLSLRRATAQRLVSHWHAGYFYPRSPCGERHAAQAGNAEYRSISIHALLAESDKNADGSESFQGLFLSTLSLRRATETEVFRCDHDTISIHALLAESD